MDQGGNGKGRCQKRAKRLANKFCDGDEDCANEVSAICDEEITCLKWAKLRQWTGLKKCGEDQDCIDDVNAAYNKSEEWCLKSCDDIKEEICGKKEEPQKSRCEALVMKRAPQCKEKSPKTDS